VTPHRRTIATPYRLFARQPETRFTAKQYSRNSGLPTHREIAMPHFSNVVSPQTHFADASCRRITAVPNGRVATLPVFRPVASPHQRAITSPQTRSGHFTSPPQNHIAGTLHSRTAGFPPNRMQSTASPYRQIRSCPADRSTWSLAFRLSELPHRRPAANPTHRHS